MGKDFEGACCETCLKYADPAAAPVPAPTPPLEAKRVKFVVTYGSGAIAEHVPQGTQVILGRGPTNDLVVKDGNISRKQCAFLFRNGRWYVKDLGSSCGIYVDGQRVDNAPMNEGTAVEMAGYVVRAVPL
jgi:pSer/pThr/pTyr-binding forkhead associated (FHA) protein